MEKPVSPREKKLLSWLKIGFHSVYLITPRSLPTSIHKINTTCNWIQCSRYGFASIYGIANGQMYKTKWSLAFGPELCTKQKSYILGSLHNDE